MPIILCFLYLTLFIQIDFPIHIDIKAWICPFCILRGNRSKFLNYHVFLSLKIVFILANSADPDEMLPYMTFHLGLHFLPMHLFIGIQNERDDYFVLQDIFARSNASQFTRFTS